MKTLSLVLLFHCSIYSSHSVYWSPVEPIQFYQTASLVCHINISNHGIPKWTGGYLGEVLTYNQTSFYYEKYTVHYDNKQQLYILNIQDFHEKDVNVVYSCFYGFEKSSRNLTLNAYKFELVPTEKAIPRVITLNNTYLALNVTFGEVLPEPRCRLFLNNQLIEPDIKIKKVGLLFHYELILRHEFDTYHVNISVEITCLIGTKTRVFKELVSNLSNPPFVNNLKKIHKAVGLIVAATAVIVIAFCLMCWNQGSKLAKQICEGIVDGKYMNLPQLNSASNELSCCRSQAREKEEREKSSYDQC